MKAKRSLKQLPKNRVNVEKSAFDAVLEKLIQSNPTKNPGTAPLLHFLPVEN
jgi:hypothetical protein